MRRLWTTAIVAVFFPAACGGSSSNSGSGSCPPADQVANAPCDPGTQCMGLSAGSTYTLCQCDGGRFDCPSSSASSSDGGASDGGASDAAGSGSGAGGSGATGGRGSVATGGRASGAGGTTTSRPAGSESTRPTSSSSSGTDGSGATVSGTGTTSASASGTTGTGDTTVNCMLDSAGYEDCYTYSNVPPSTTASEICGAGTPVGSCPTTGKSACCIDISDGGTLSFSYCLYGVPATYLTSQQSSCTSLNGTWVVP